MSSRLPNVSPSQALGYQQSSRQEGPLCVGGPEPSLMFTWSSDTLSHPVSLAVTGSSWWLRYVQEMSGDGLLQIQYKLRGESHMRDDIHNYMFKQIPFGVCSLTFWDIRMQQEHYVQKSGMGKENCDLNCKFSFKAVPDVLSTSHLHSLSIWIEWPGEDVGSQIALVGQARSRCREPTPPHTCRPSSDPHLHVHIAFESHHCNRDTRLVWTRQLKRRKGWARLQTSVSAHSYLEVTAH